MSTYLRSSGLCSGCGRLGATILLSKLHGAGGTCVGMCKSQELERKVCVRDVQQ